MPSAYCVAADIDSRFGESAVDQWCTLSPGDSTATKTDRKTLAISIASDELDEVLRCLPAMENHLPIPTVNISPNVRDKVAIKAGLWLYSFHATDDWTSQPGYFATLWKVYDQWVTELRAGTRKLDLG
jgi:hypothetical protein